MAREYRGEPANPSLDQIEASKDDSNPASQRNRNPSQDGTRQGTGIEVALKLQGGAFVVPVEINNSFSLNFTVDSGAADVSIPADVVLTLIRLGTIKNSDFLGTRLYRLADGSTVPSKIFNIHTLSLGGRNITNVVGSVSSITGGLLLGQTFLTRFSAWSIDNRRHVLRLE